MNIYATLHSLINNQNKIRYILPHILRHNQIYPGISLLFSFQAHNACTLLIQIMNAEENFHSVLLHDTFTDTNDQNTSSESFQSPPPKSH